MIQVLQTLTLIRLINLFFSLLQLALIIRVILSFIRLNRYNRTYYLFADFIYRVTEPFLAPVRNLLPTSSLGLDFSPVVVALLAGLVQRFLIVLLLQITR